MNEPTNDRLNEYRQASRDAKYFGSLFKRMAILQAILGELAELEDVVRAKHVEAQTSMADADVARAALDAVRAEGAKIITDAEAEATTIKATAKAEADRMAADVAAAEALLVKLEGEAKTAEGKVQNRLRQLAEEDQKLRRTREMIADLKKNLPT